MQKLLQLQFSKLLMLVALTLGLNAFGQVTESFDSATTPPTGWTYNSVSHGTNNPRTGARCATFNAVDDAITSPAVATPNQLSFWYKRSSNTTAWSLKIEVLNSSNTVVATLPALTSSTETYQQYTANLSSYSGIKIKITDTRSSGTNERYLDDFSITVQSGPSVTTTTVVPTTNSATLNGTINANSTTVAASFNYGTTTAYGSTVAATPSSVTGATATAISAPVSSLSINTQYYFRAVGTISSTATNGSGVAFYTLANVPGAPVVSGATTNTFTVALNTATQNSNPSETLYAIRVGTQYVQASGALAAGEIWQTAGNWGTKTVTGLTDNTTYSVSVKAKNGDNVETIFGSSVNGVTLTDTTPRYSATALAAFGPVCVNTTTTDRSFTLTGSYLTGDVSIGPFNGYSFSTTANGTYSTSLSLTPVSGSLNNIIHVKFTPITVTSYSGNIAITGGGATSINVAASGNGINTVGAVTTTAATAITATTATLGGNVTSEGCSAVSRGVVYATTATPAILGTGVTQLPLTATGTGTYTVSATGLNPATLYYARAYATNGGGTVYGAQVTFTTACASLTLPFNENFEATTFPPACWARFRGTNNLGTSDDWIRTTSNTYNASAGAAFADFESVTEGQLTEDWLVTPALVIPNNGSPIKLKFQERQAYAELYGTNYYVKVSTTSQTSHAAFTDVIHYGEDAFSTIYSERTIDLSAYAGQTIYVAFVMSQNDGDSWYVDNVSVKEELAAPLATAATDVMPHSFTANWNSVTNATSYLLDVATSGNFVDTLISENFSGFTSSNSNRSTVLDTYLQNPGWTGVNVYDNPGSARLGAGTNTGSITTPTVNLSVNNGNAVLSFQLAPYSSDTGTIVQVLHAPDGINFAQVGSNITIPASATNYTLPITGGTASSKIRIQSASGASTRFYIDNIVISSSAILPLYSSLSVSSTSLSVTGLLQNTNYFYRVRAVGSISTSASSNTISVTTGKELIWNGSQWTGNATPRNIDSGSIEGIYNTTDNGAFSIGALTVASTGTLTVTSGSTINVVNDVVNNATAAAFTIQNNGALLQKTTATTNTNLGNILVVKNSNPLYRLDYTLWSSPVDGLTLGNFSPDTSTGRLYEYGFNTTDNREQYNTVDASTVFVPAKGYLIRMPNGNLSVPGYNGGTASYSFIGRFNGKPHNGNYSIPAAANQGYTAVGNPYPSPISVVDFFTANSGVINGSSGLYFWRKRNNAAASSYATLTLAAYTSNAGYSPNAGTTDPEEDPYDGGGQEQAVYFEGAESTWRISQGQGFFVQTAATPTGTTINFTNSMRKPSAGDQAFFRTGSAANDNRSRIWLNLTDAQHSRSQAAIAYLDNATIGLDYGYDGALLNDGGSVALYSLAANTTLAIQARPAFTATDVVPMGFIAAAPGQYSISIDHADGLFEGGQEVFIKDNLLGTTNNLENAYTFTTEAGTFNERFEVVYTTSALDINTPLQDTNTVIAYKHENAIQIISGTAEIKGLTVYDIRGRKLYNKSNINARQTTIEGLQVAHEVVMIEVKTTKGTINKKIVY